ncbi:MAG: zinc ribbon domain-containing protein [Thermodesulfobacteriota bacterium]|nr:zinc ribbon domain-containing protein [Thermodesulfobacteriota bacterium]
MISCPECNSQNPDGARFCNACGSKIEFACPQCGNGWWVKCVF